jgi:hypothetical protein
MVEALGPDRAGNLYKAHTGRWALGEIELTCGSRFQVWVEGHWIDVTVEHDGAGYCAIPAVIRLHVGLQARLLNKGSG